MKTHYKDRLGKDIYEGDILLYATTSGTGGRIECFRVIGQTAQKLKVTSGFSKWGGRKRISYINHPETGVVLTAMGDPVAIFNQMNEQV